MYNGFPDTRIKALCEKKLYLWENYLLRIFDKNNIYFVSNISIK